MLMHMSGLPVIEPTADGMSEQDRADMAYHVASLARGRADAMELLSALGLDEFDAWLAREQLRERRRL